MQSDQQPDQQPDHQTVVGQYLMASRPPINATNADVVAVVNAWNALCEKLKQTDAKP